MLTHIKINGEKIDVQTIEAYDDDQLSDAIKELQYSAVQCAVKLDDIRLSCQGDTKGNEQFYKVRMASRWIDLSLKHLYEIRRKRNDVSARFMEEAEYRLSPELFDEIKKASGLPSRV